MTPENQELRQSEAEFTVHRKRNTQVKIATRAPAFKGVDLNPRLTEALSQQYPMGLIFTKSPMRDFLREAISKGVYCTIPPNYDDETWVRDRNITGIYFLSGAREIDLAGIYEISRERVRQITVETIKRLGFPPSNRPIKLKDYKVWPEEYTLLIRGGAGNRLVEMIEQGKTAQDLYATEKPNSKDHDRFSKQLHCLRGLGIEVAGLRMSKIEGQQLAWQLQDETLTDEQIQILLHQVRIYHFYNVHTKGENPILVPVQSLIKGVGFHYQVTEFWRFLKALEESKIPIGRLKIKVKSGSQKGEYMYHFIARIHQERALNILRNKPDLKRFLQNPVIQLCGPSTRLPTSYELVKRRGVRRVGSLLREFGVFFRPSVELKHSLLFTPDFPITIFRHQKYQGSQPPDYYYPIDQEEAFRSLIQQKRADSSGTPDPKISDLVKHS